MIDQSHNISCPLLFSHPHRTIMISACTFRGIFTVQNATVYAVDKKRYCGIQRDLRGPKCVSRYNFDPGYKMLIARLAALFTVWRSGQINIRNKAIDRIPGMNIELNELSWINMLCLLRLKSLLQRRTILLYALH
ncbi:hypothetical protein M405DRAFT_598495 [Rhizopogon salebrosus TDB-379]|nr:hypothetical protein M405DRAFT_598495 [Rhizopogon salebrosus TDB-379]